MTQNTHLTTGEDTLRIQEYRDSGNTEYLGRLYEKYKRKIYSQCFSLLKNNEEAKDIASETFIKAFENIDKFDIALPFSPWLCRIATNLCIDYLRKKSRYKHQPLEENTLFESQEPGKGKEEYREDTQDILGAIRLLKPVQRRCFCLFYVHDLSYKEISELTGYSPGKVRSYIQNGRRNFKLFMEKR